MAKTTDDGKDFGDPDIDDLDWGDPLDDPDSPGKDRKPVERFGHGFLSGVKETAKTPSLYTNALRTALPEGYSAAFQLGEDVVQKGQGLYNEVSKDLAPAAKEMKRLLRTANNSAKAYLPEKLSKKLDEWLKEEPAPAKTSNYDPTESAITSELSEIFKAQVEQTEATRAEEAVRDAVEKKRFNSQYKQLDEIRRLLNQQNAYQDSVNVSYQRKSLEISMRQMFIQRDLLEITKAGVQETSAQLRDITKNTALPEIVKVRNSEIFEQITKDRLLGKVADRFAPLARDVFNRVSKSILTRVKEVTGNIRDGVDSAAMMQDNMSGMDGFDALGEAGKMAGSYSLGWVTDKVAKWAKPKIAQNDAVTAKGNDLMFKAKNWDQLLKKRLEDSYPTSWFGEVMRDSVLGAMRWGGRQKIGNDTISQATTPTSWDNLSRKSLVEIIPGFLARILQSSEGIRTKGEVPLMTYDHDRNEFTTVSGLASRIKKRLVTDDDLERLSADSEELIDLFDKNKDITPETRNKVKQFLIREAKAGNNADFERFTDHYAYRGLGMTGGEIDQVIDLLQTGLGMDWNGNLGTDVNSTKLKVDFADRMRALKGNLPQFTERTNMYANTSNMEALRAAGVVRKVMDEDHLNPEYFDQRFRQFLEGEQSDADSSHQTYPGSALDSYNDALRHGNTSVSQGTGRTRRRASESGNSDLYAAVETLRTQLGAENQRQVEALDALVSGSALSIETLTTAVKDASSREEVAESNNLLREILAAIDSLRESGIPVSGSSGGSGSISSAIGNYGGSLRRRFKRININTGAISERANRTYGNIRSKLGTVNAEAPGFFNRTKDTVEKYASSLKQQASSLYGRASGAVSGMDWGRFENARKIVGDNAQEIWEQLDPAKVKLGEYRDAATGAIIKTFSDVKKSVSGVVDIDDLQDRASNLGGQIRDGVNRGVSGLRGAYERIDLSKLRQAPEIIGETAQEIWEQLDPSKLELGHYRDKITGKVIETAEDIKNSVSDVAEFLSQKKKAMFTNNNRAKAFARRYLGRGIYGLLSGGLTAAKFGGRQLGKGFGDLGRAALAGGRALRKLNYGRIGRTIGGVGKAAFGGAAALGKFGVTQLGKGFVDLKNLGLGAGRLLRKIPMNGGLTRLAGAGLRGAGGLLRFGGRQLGKGFGDLGRVVKGAGKLLAGGLPFFGGAKKVVRAVDRIYDLLVRFFAFKGMPIDQLKADGVDDKTGKITLRQRMRSVYDRMRDSKGAWAQRITGWKDSLAKYRKKGNTNEPDKPEEESNGKGWLGAILGVVSALGSTITNVFGGVGKMITGRLTWLGEYLAARMAAGAIADGISDASLPDGEVDKDGKKKPRKKVSRWKRITAKLGGRAGAANAARTGGTVVASQGARMAGTAALATAGRTAAVAGAAGAAATAGGTIAAIAGFLVSWPVMAVVAVGTAGYYTYKYFKEKLDPFQKLRIAQYGIPLDERDAILKVFETEHQLSKHIQWEGDVAANIAEGFKAEEILQRFDVNVTDPESLRGFTVWFNNRFKPIFLRYMTTIKQLMPGVPIHEIDDKIKPEQMQAFLSATKFPATMKNHPYVFTLSPFENIDIVQGTTEIDDASTEISNIIKANRHKEKAADIKSRVEPLKTGATVTDMIKIDAEKRKAAEARAILTNAGSPTNRAEMREQVAMLEQQKATQSGVAAAMTQHRIDEKTKFMGKAFYEYEKAKPKDEKWVAALQKDTENFKAAFDSDAPTDGYYSKVPLPTGDGSWEAVKDTILTAAALIGVNPQTLANFAKVESGFNTRIKAKTSSATGLFQFINSTWRGMMDQYGSKLGIPRDAKPTDPVASSLLAAQFIKMNADHLRNKLGREPSVTDSYIAHFLGPAGASKFLTASPTAIAAEVMPSAANANRSIFYGPSGPRTVAEVYNLMGNKVNGNVMATPKRLVDQHEVTQALAANSRLDPSMTASKVSYNKNSGTSTGVLSDLTAGILDSTQPVRAGMVNAVSSNEKPKTQKAALQLQTTPAERLELRSRQVQEQTKLVSENQAMAMTRTAAILEESLKVQHAINASIREIGTFLKGAMNESSKPKSAAPATQTASTANNPPVRPVVESPNAPLLLRRNV